MAPRKRVSRIPSRIEVPPELMVTGGSGRTIGIQTDPEPNAKFVAQPSKRQKILEKIKQLNKTKNPEMPSSSSEASCSASSSSSSLGKSANKYPILFMPGPNEKSCQVEESELAAISRPKSDFAYKMEFLKSEVDRRRMESIIGDINRLDALDEMINHDPPPRWSAACEMWLEVDQLEARVEAFTKKAELKQAAAGQKNSHQGGENK